MVWYKKVDSFLSIDRKRRYLVQKPSNANFSCRTLYGSYPVSVMFSYCLIGSYPQAVLFYFSVFLMGFAFGILGAVSSKLWAIMANNSPLGTLFTSTVFQCSLFICQAG